jgi:hypothetical protein
MKYNGQEGEDSKINPTWTQYGIGIKRSFLSSKNPIHMAGGFLRDGKKFGEPKCNEVSS